MPLVNKKKFAYTDAGKKEAYEYAKKTGSPIQEVNQFGRTFPFPNPKKPPKKPR